MGNIDLTSYAKKENVYTKEQSDSKYQPKGEYALKSDITIAHLEHAMRCYWRDKWKDLGDLDLGRPLFGDEVESLLDERIGPLKINLRWLRERVRNIEQSIGIETPPKPQK